MVLIRSGVGIAALAFGILLGFVLFQSPSRADQLSERAYHLASAGQQGDAITVYSEELRQHPKDYLVYLRRGVTFADTNHPVEALADLSTALRLSPRALTVEQLGKRADDSSRSDTHTTAMVVEIHAKRAEVLESMNRLDEALADLDAAVMLNSRDFEILHHRAVLRTFTGQFDGAIADFDRILGRGPNNVQALAARGTAKYLKADWTGAAADFGRAVNIKPDSGNYAIWLLKAQLRGRQPIPVSEFQQLPQDNPAWVSIDAFLSNYSTAEMAERLSDGIGGDPARACRGAVFMGEWLEIKGDAYDAPSIFQDAMTLCKPGTVQQAVARFELKRLQAMVLTPPAPEEDKKPEAPRSLASFHY